MKNYCMIMCERFPTPTARPACGDPPWCIHCKKSKQPKTNKCPTNPIRGQGKSGRGVHSRVGKGEPKMCPVCRKTGNTKAAVGSCIRSGRGEATQEAGKYKALGILSRLLEPI